MACRSLQLESSFFLRDLFLSDEFTLDGEEHMVRELVDSCIWSKIVVGHEICLMSWDQHLENQSLSHRAGLIGVILIQ